MERRTLSDVLFEFDKSQSKLDLHDVAIGLRSAKDTELSPESKDVKPYLAECAAFDLYTSNDWNTFFAILADKGKECGDRLCESLDEFKLFIYEYWNKRSRIARHPVLAHRYADLCWSLCQELTDKQRDVTVAHLMIDSVIKAAENNLFKYPITARHELEESLILSIQLNDKVRIAGTCKAIIDFEDTYASDDLKGVWGMSFDLLIGNKGVNLGTVSKHNSKIPLDHRQM